MAKMGIILPSPGSVFRHLGSGSRTTTWDQIGCGVVDKSGQTVDFTDFRAPSLCLVWIIRGAGSYQDEHGRIHSLTAGDCFQRWPGRLHTTRIVPDSGWREFYLNLGHELPVTLGRLGVLDAQKTVWHLGLEPARLRQWSDLRTTLHQADARDLPGHCLELQRLMLEAQGCDHQGEGPTDPIVEACRALAGDLAGRQDLQDFCRHHELDYENLRKRFRREIGCSPGQYRIQRRVERACALLLSTSTPIREIASALGYASAFDFSTQFRRHMGISPRHYRNPQGRQKGSLVEPP
jgi:AraC family transcriptional regulator, arabinose operon regulatory protein